MYVLSFENRCLNSSSTSLALSLMFNTIKLKSKKINNSFVTAAFLLSFVFAFITFVMVMLTMMTHSLQRGILIFMVTDRNWNEIFIWMSDTHTPKHTNILQQRLLALAQNAAQESERELLIISKSLFYILSHAPKVRCYFVYTLYAGLQLPVLFTYFVIIVLPGDRSLALYERCVYAHAFPLSRTFRS